MLLEPKRLRVSSDIQREAIEDAAELLGSIEPFTYLCCASGNVDHAKKAIEEFTGIRIAVLPVEALADPYGWFLVGPNGVVWSGIV
jgi:hypothetical protein